MFQCLMSISVKKCFRTSSLNVYWCILRPLSLALLLAACEKRLIPTPASFQGAAEGNKFSPETPFLQLNNPSFLIHTSSPFTTFLPFSEHAPAPQCFLLVRGSKVNTIQCSLISAKFRGMILLATLFLIQVRVPLTVLAL